VDSSTLINAMTIGIKQQFHAEINILLLFSRSVGNRIAARALSSITAGNLSMISETLSPVASTSSISPTVMRVTVIQGDLTVMSQLHT